MPLTLSAKQNEFLTEKSENNLHVVAAVTDSHNEVYLTDESDHELIRQIKSGNQAGKAFESLVSRYQKMVYFHIRRMIIDHDDTNDVVQITFIKAWKGLENFREDARFYTWIYRIATNEALTFLKQKKRRSLIPMDDVEHQLAGQLEHDPLISSNSLQLKLHQAILTLPEKQRLVFHMRYFDEIKYEDMSQILDTSVGALKASYHHAVNKIKSYFDKH
jgi:RNA polymerase sigma factor (sigma-70 family)